MKRAVFLLTMAALALPGCGGPYAGQVTHVIPNVAEVTEVYRTQAVSGSWSYDFTVWAAPRYNGRVLLNLGGAESLMMTAAEARALGEEIRGLSHHGGFLDTVSRDWDRRKVPYFSVTVDTHDRFRLDYQWREAEEGRVDGNVPFDLSRDLTRGLGLALIRAADIVEGERP